MDELSRKPFLEQKAKYDREYRAIRVRSGKCGWCGAIRKKYKWLCDYCAGVHRDKQRAKAKEKHAI